MIVAKVNDYEISLKEYQMELADVQRKMKLEQPSNEAKKSAVERLIDGYLLLESAQNQEITSDEIDDELLNFKLRFNSEEEFNEMLTKENLAIDSIRENLSQTLKIRKFIAAKFEVKCEVEEDKIKDFYEKNRDYMQGQIGNPDGDDKPNKKYYDPRKWLRAGQETLVARVLVAFEDLNAMNRN